MLRELPRNLDCYCGSWPLRLTGSLVFDLGVIES
jgi:hypothetical protein